MKCPICKLPHEPAYAIETVCVKTLQDHLKAALELLAIREEQIGEFLEEREPKDEIDKEIAAMSDEEIIEAVEKSAGSMPDYPDP